MKYRISAFCLFIVSPLFIFSQGSFSYDIQLRQVDFENGSTMRMDDNSANYTNVIEYVHIGGGSYTTAPVAYRAGNSFGLTAEFQTGCLDVDVFIRGRHVRPDGTILFFPAQEITPDGNGQLNYAFDHPEENGNQFFFPIGFAEFHDPFEIVWQFSLDNSMNDSDWVDIHTSANPVYVTKAFPNFAGHIGFHTYYRTSCKAANGLNDNASIINEVWNVFANDGTFRRADDDGTLAYYSEWEEAQFWGDSLIVTGNGQCTAFSMAFLNCLKAQGINQSNDYLFVTAELAQSNAEFGLLVKNFGSSTTVPFAHWANNTAPPVPTGYNIDKVVIPLQDQNPYNFTNSVFADNVLYSEITDLGGVAGQSEANPKSVFLNHQIISLNVAGTTKLYDVPYGLTYDSLNQMRDNLYGYIYEVEDVNVNEFSLGIDLNDNNTLETSVAVTVWLIDTDPLALDLDGQTFNNF